MRNGDTRRLRERAETKERERARGWRRERGGERGEATERRRQREGGRGEARGIEREERESAARAANEFIKGEGSRERAQEGACRQGCAREAGRQTEPEPEPEAKYPLSTHAKRGVTCARKRAMAFIPAGR